MLSLSSLPSLDPSSGVSDPSSDPLPGVSPSPSLSGVPFDGVPVDGMLVGLGSSPQSTDGTVPGFPPTWEKVAETVIAERATRVSVEKRILLFVESSIALRR